MPIAIEKFFDAVFQCCGKTKAAKDPRSSLDTTVQDQNLDHGPVELGSTTRLYVVSSDDTCTYGTSRVMSYGLINYSTKKHWPQTGSNISKPPTLFEIPKVNNPTAWVSSKTQEDTKPIKKLIQTLTLVFLHEFSFHEFA